MCDMHKKVEKHVFDARDGKDVTENKKKITEHINKCSSCRQLFIDLTEKPPMKLK